MPRNIACAIIYIIIMVKTSDKTKRAAAKKSAKTISAKKVEEIKLGKFCDSEPMRLPEVTPSRVWQLIGGIALLLIGIFCVATMFVNFPFSYLWQGESNLWQADTMPLTISWIVNNLALVIFTIFCVIGSILLFAKQRVPVMIWYVLIVTLVVGFISQSVGIYTNYTTRECLEESCPLVVGELGTVLLCDLTIFMLGLVLIWMVYKTNLHYGCPKSKKKRR